MEQPTESSPRTFGLHSDHSQLLLRSRFDLKLFILTLLGEMVFELDKRSTYIGRLVFFNFIPKKLQF
jgi:hypothetical protein